jgi:HAMP domain-containing protein
MDNRRSLPKTLINSRAQFRSAIPFFILLIAAVALFIFNYWQIANALTQETASAPEDIARLSAFSDIAARAMMNSLIGIVVMSLLSLILWLIYSHRIFGPTVPIRRHIDLLCQGNYDSQITLRKTDEFHDIADDLNRLTSVLKNERGQALVQVIVASGIMGILVLAMASMFSVQAKESRALVEKLAAADLYRSMNALLGNPSVCASQIATANLAGSGSLTFDTTSVTPDHPHVIELQRIKNSVGGPDLISLGSTASSMSNTLSISSTSGIQLSITSATTANFLINFDQTKLVRGIHNLTLPVTIQTSGPATSATLIGCGGAGGGVSIVFGNLAGPSSLTKAMCPPTSRLASCSIRSYSGGDGQGYPELQQVTYLDRSGYATGAVGGYSNGYAVPTGSIISPQGCSYFNTDGKDSAQVAATCI